MPSTEKQPAKDDEHRQRQRAASIQAFSHEQSRNVMGRNNDHDQRGSQGRAVNSPPMSLMQLVDLSVLLQGDQIHHDRDIEVSGSHPYGQFLSTDIQNSFSHHQGAHHEVPFTDFSNPARHPHGCVLDTQRVAARNLFFTRLVTRAMSIVSEDLRNANHNFETISPHIDSTGANFVLEGDRSALESMAPIPAEPPAEDMNANQDAQRPPTNPTFQG